MFDVDKLKEAVEVADNADHSYSGWQIGPYEATTLTETARLVVAGQPLWWCEEHQVSAHNDDECWQQVWGQDDDYTLTRCRMVEGWWMPTGKDET